MKFIDIVKKRQSVREYLTKPVPRDVLDRCIEAARLAPSACNSQPWFFIVVDEKTLKDKLADVAFSGVYSINSFIKEAPVLIVVITKRSKYIARLGGHFRGVQYSLLDIGIACEHLILQAEEEGLGTCWLGWFNEKAVKEVLDLSRDDKVDVMISIGYSKTDIKKEKKRKSLAEVRHFV